MNDYLPFLKLYWVGIKHGKDSGNNIITKEGRKEGRKEGTNERTNERTNEYKLWIYFSKLTNLAWFISIMTYLWLFLTYRVKHMLHFMKSAHKSSQYILLLDLYELEFSSSLSPGTSATSILCTLFPTIYTQTSAILFPVFCSRRDGVYSDSILGCWIFFPWTNV